MNTLHRSNAARVGRRGLTLLEVTVVATLLLFGLLALTTTTQALAALRAAESEQQSARNALDSAVRSIQGVSASERQNADGWSTALVRAFDPGGAIRPTFDVRGLRPWEGEATVGTVELVLDETLTDDEVGFVLGMPQDLNGDGVIVSADVSADAQLLPFLVRLRWRGPGGRREIVQGVYASRY